MNCSNEREMVIAFGEQKEKLLSQPDRFVKTEPVERVGIESEVAVHAAMEARELTNLRDEILAEHPGFTDTELGAVQIEVRTPPVDLSTADGVSALKGIYGDHLALVRGSAHRRGAKILRAGANPFFPAVGAPRTEKPKYRLVPDFYNRNRSPLVDTVIGLGANRLNVGDAAIVSLFQSFQVNLEASSLEDACEKMNYSLGIAPYLLSFSGNARYLNGADTKMQDMRFIGWEKSHDTRTICDTKLHDARLLSWERSFDVRPPESGDWKNELRVGLPGRYFRNIADYLERAGTFPFILHSPEAALAISIGMTWLDARVKFIGDSSIVELRLLSTQPSMEEEVVLLLLYLGLLREAQERRAPLMPIEMVRENRLTAMLYGTEKPMWFLDGAGRGVKLSAIQGLSFELEKAKNGLRRLGILSSLDEELLREMFRLGSPSQRLAARLNGTEKNVSVREMENALTETGMLK